MVDDVFYNYNPKPLLTEYFNEYLKGGFSFSGLALKSEAHTANKNIYKKQDFSVDLEPGGALNLNNIKQIDKNLKQVQEGVGKKNEILEELLNEQ